MKIIFTQDTEPDPLTGNQYYGQGALVDLRDDRARAVINLGWARPADAPTPEPHPVAVQDDVPPWPAVAPDSEADDLTAIAGIGPALMAELNGMGITTYTDLAGADAEWLDTNIARSKRQISSWQKRAKELA